MQITEILNLLACNMVCVSEASADVFLYRSFYPEEENSISLEIVAKCLPNYELSHAVRP